MKNASVVKYKGLEILCRAETLARYREGKLTKDEVLISDEIYKSVKKGDKANAEDLLEALGSANKAKCLKTMLDQGSTN